MKVYFVLLVLTFACFPGEYRTNKAHIHMKESSISERNAKDCKVTALGTDYLGQRDRTKSGELCQHWTSAFFQNENVESMQKVKDVPFLLDGSWKAAKNLCRNPNADKNGPWCFVLGGEGKKDYCDVPLCSQTDCRKTGIGQEILKGYNQTVFGKDCSVWKDHSLKGNAFCANPTGNISGPWCFTQGGEKQPCDVPICDFRPCTKVVSPALRNFTHFVALSGRRRLHLKFKAWDASLQNVGQGVKILISSVPHLEGNAGFELQVLNNGLVLSKWPQRENEDKVSKHHNPPTLNVSGTHWSEFWLEWDDLKIRVGSKEGKDDLISIKFSHHEQMRFYALGGLMAMWNSDFCCEVHVTTSMDVTHFWPLSKSESGYEVQLSIQAFHSPVIALHFGPDPLMDHYAVVLDSHSRDGLFWVHKGKAVERIVKKNKFPFFQDFQQWQSFTLHIFGEEMKLIWRASDTANKTILEFTEPNIGGLRWVSVGSNKTLANWLINCKPKDRVREPLVSHEDCLRDSVGHDYFGSRAASSRGWPCIPWTHPRVDDAFKMPLLFPEGSALAASNFCRNPNRQPGGPWCFTLDAGFPPKTCGIKECSAKACRRAGTGNDYMGHLNKTISGRTCQKWTGMMPHVVDWELLKKENFPERSVENALNYCRNPSRTLIGSFCFTTDPNIRVDACFVPNCLQDFDQTQTVITMGLSEAGRSFFMLPSWRQDGFKFSVKQWDPLGRDGLRITVKPLKGDISLRISIGAEHNSLIKMTYNSSKTGEKILYERKVAHVVGVAEWSSFIMHVNEQKVELGFASHPFPFLKWKSPGHDYPLFSPVYFSLGSEHGNLLGVNFPAQGCFTMHEDVIEGKFFELAGRANTFFHINQWLPNSSLANQKKLDLYLRGAQNSQFALALSSLGDFSNGYDLIRFNTNSLEFGWVSNESEMQYYKKQNYNATVVPSLHFRHFSIRFTENELDVISEDGLIKFHFEHRHGEKILWYVFTTAARGKVIWSANCEPQDVDHVRDGGWSEWSDWQCSKVCGGGHGSRSRSCSAPAPSLLGQFCQGKDRESGACNDFPCGKTSYATRRKIRTFLNSAANTFTREPGASFNFSCEPPLMRILIRELTFEKHKVSLVWAKQGVFYKDDRNSTLFSIQKLGANDSGVYSLAALRKKEPNSAVTFCFFTLTVLKKVQIRADEKLTLDDQIGELAFFYQTLVVNWLSGDVIVQKISLNPEVQKHEMKIDYVQKSKHAGGWKCMVRQPELDLSWVTAWYQVEVLPPQTIGLTLAEGPVLSIIFKPVMRKFGEAMVVPILVLFSLAGFVLLSITFKLFFWWRRARRRSAHL